MGGSVSTGGSPYSFAIRIDTTDVTGRQLKRAGYKRRKDAEAVLKQVVDLIDLAGADERMRRRIGDMVFAARYGRPMPTVETVRRKLGAGLDPNAQSLTMGEWLDQWLAAKRDVNQRTRDSYESVVRLHLRPHLGTVQLDKLTSAHVAAMFDAIEARNVDPRLRDSDPRDVRSRKSKVTLPTQYKIRKVLAMVLRSAIEHRLIDRMPAGWGNLLPSPPRRPPTVWTPEQVNRFLEATHDDRLHALWWLALLRGPRRSELLAMRWQDVDWQAREIAIPGSKTEAGIRSIPLSEEGVGILRAHRKRQAEERLATFGAYDDHDLVFAREDGSPIPGHQITFGFQRLARELELPVIRFHDARHTAATLGLEAGMDIVVMSRMLGHANVRITMDTYQHVRRQVFEDATAKIDALLAANRSGSVRDSGR